jgi:hypothetical protein
MKNKKDQHRDSLVTNKNGKMLMMSFIDFLEIVLNIGIRDIGDIGSIG